MCSRGNIRSFWSTFDFRPTINTHRESESSGGVLMDKVSRNRNTQIALILGRGGAEHTCRTRRCLAEMLIEKNYLSQPQYEDCMQMIHVPFMEYQTLAVVSMNSLWSECYQM